MKVLYFDMLSLFYSNEYFHHNVSAHAKYKYWFNTLIKTLLEMVEPNFQAIDKLRRAASKADLPLYPLGTRHTRTCFIENFVLQPPLQSTKPHHSQYREHHFLGHDLG